MKRNILLPVALILVSCLILAVLIANGCARVPAYEETQMPEAVAGTLTDISDAVITDTTETEEVPISYAVSENDVFPNVFREEYYREQLDGAAEACYTAILESELGEGPTTEWISVDLSNLPVSERSFDVTLEETRESDNLIVMGVVDWKDADFISAARTALVYDHPELSWLVNTAAVYSFEMENDPRYGRDLAVGESAQYDGTLVLSNINFQLTSEGYEEATTDCDSVWSEDRYSYADTGDLEEIEEAIDRAVADIGSLDGATDYQKALAIHDWICLNAAYADESGGRFLNSWRGYQTAHSALVDGVTVCAGYAKTFKLLCDEYGLPCVIVVGTMDGGSHAWNYVEIDGQWYAVDCTVDDNEYGAPYHDRFLLGQSFSTYAQEGPIGSVSFVYPALSVYDYEPNVQEAVATATPDADPAQAATAWDELRGLFWNGLAGTAETWG